MSTGNILAWPQPDRTAVVIAETGESIDYARLQSRALAFARLFIERCAQGEVIAVLLSNRVEYFEVCFAARRAGLYYVPVSTHLTAGELAHILADSGARLLITEAAHAGVVAALDEPLRRAIEVMMVDDATIAELGSSAAAARSPACAAARGEPASGIAAGGPGPAPAADGLPVRPMGLDFAYSSGTTGRPKGIRHAMSGDPQLAAAMQPSNWTSFFGLDRNAVYLSPAPLYHAAPLRFSVRCLAAGGTVVVMRRFDPAAALAAIARHRVTHSQWVPTMFVRLLGLPPEERAAHDLSSHRMALHAAAPCPIEVKRRMIDWWGPIVWEYYTGSERAGATVISPQDWLAHPGSVGRAVQGRLHIVDDDGRPCPPGTDGLVCFEGGPRFAYHNDPVKTAQAHTPEGWATFGDIGHVDGDGYLYLTDRRANMIISGGVNIYPQEAENVLLGHPLVHDAAVIGIPNPDFGEEVKAVVELRDPEQASPEVARALIAHCRQRLSPIKCPRSIDFATDLPRTETGKLLKRLIRDRYRAALQAAGATDTSDRPQP